MDRKIEKICIVACCILIQGLSSLQAQDWPTLRIPNAIVEIPAKLGEDAPFDLNAYYSIPDSENREQVYLQAFIESGLIKNTNLEPPAAFFPPNDAYFLSRKFQKRLKDQYRHFKQLSEFHRKCMKDRKVTIEGRDIERARKYVKHFDELFVRLSQAGQKSNCFIHRPARSGDNTFLEAVSAVFWILELRYLADPYSPTLINDIDTALDLSCDLRYLAPWQSQQYSNECVNKVVRPMLSDKKQPVEQLRKLVDVLKRHHEKNKKVNSIVETSRWNYLLTRHALLEFRDKTFRQTWPEGTDAYKISKVLESFHCNLGGDDRPDSMNARWQNSKRPRSEIDQVSELSGTLEKPRGHDSWLRNRQMVNSFVASGLLATTTSEFERDLQILRTRYQQIQDACQADFPTSHNNLSILNDNWTLSDDWNSSFFFVVCNPLQLPSQATNQVDSGACLCLAAAKLWRTEHGTKNPADLEQALLAVGVGKPVIDPHSGKSFKYKPSKSTIIVYSVGPDRIDQKGKKMRIRRASELRYPPDPRSSGDVVFEAKF